jgi:hypothetical protein
MLNAYDIAFLETMVGNVFPLPAIFYIAPDEVDRLIGKRNRPVAVCDDMPYARFPPPLGRVIPFQINTHEEIAREEGDITPFVFRPGLWKKSFNAVPPQSAHYSSFRVQFGMHCVPLLNGNRFPSPALKKRLASAMHTRPSTRKPTIVEQAAEMRDTMTLGTAFTGPGKPITRKVRGYSSVIIA